MPSRTPQPQNFAAPPLRRSAAPLLFALPLLFLTIFFFYPLAAIFRISLRPDTILSLLNRPHLLKIIGFTFWQATLSTLFTLAIGLPAAYLFARWSFRGQTLLRALTTLPFVMPTVVTAAAYRVLLGGGSPFNRLLMTLFDLQKPPIQLEQTLSIIILAHVFYNVAIVSRLVGGFWAHLSPNLASAARVMGASSARAFIEVTLPLLAPAILSASLLAFLFSFTSFGVILILGGPSFSTIETEIYRQYVTFLQPDIAAALSLLQIGFTFILMAIYARLQRKTAVTLSLHPQQANKKQARTDKEKLFLNSIIIILLLFFVSPLLALLWRSLVDRDGQLTLAYYQALPASKQGSVAFVPPLKVIRNSLVYALLTVVVASFFGLLSATLLTRPFRGRKWLDPLFMLPLGASAVTLGFGYVVSFHWLRTSPLLVLIAHTLVAFPFVVRTLLPVMQGIRPTLREAAAVMGADPAQVWREVDLPIVGRAMLAAAVFAFTVSMGEFGATNFIVRPNSGYLTLPIIIRRYLRHPGSLNYGQAMAMSVLLMLVCAIGFIAIEHFRYADIGEF